MTQQNASDNAAKSPLVDSELSSCLENLEISKKMAEFSLKKAIVEELQDLYEKNSADQRYQVLVMVSSLAWIKNGKVSVWVEDPSSHGITILCSFINDSCPALKEDRFLIPNAQYLVSNVLININRTKVLFDF
jgi:hypothetical protein